MIAQSEYARRRRQLMRMIEPGAIAIVPAAPVRVRNRDAEYAYRQDSDFHYLCGFPEPESVLVLVPGREQGECILFCRERDPDRETWDGPRSGPDGVVAHYGADDAFPVGDMDEILPGLLEGRERVYYTMGRFEAFDHRVMSWINRLRGQARNGARPPEEFVSLDHLLHDMRLFKSRAELSLMRRAAQVTAAAHKRAMRACRPGRHEYEIEAELQYVFRASNAVAAYLPIVGSGPNACILHYVANDRRMEEGDLLLMDAGAEVDCYASDVTRTFPVGGRFSREQRALYEIVLRAQLEAIEKARPGNHWDDPHHAAVRVITDGLAELGILKGDVESLIGNQAYRRFFMHRTGHWIGLDVHDVGDYRVDGKPRLLEPGMAMTVEPGIYIAPGARGVARRWQGIGIRIEDDVVITRDGPRVLSRDVPKDPDAIEALMRGRNAA